MSANEHWGKEEFEDAVARSIVGMFETKVKKHKQISKHAKFTPEILNRVRNIGCYFAAPDRIIGIDCHDNDTAKAIQKLDIKNEGRPYFAAMTHTLRHSEHDVKNENSMRHNCFLEHTYMERITQLPKPLLCKVEGRKYRLVKMWINQYGFMEASCYYLVITHLGEIHSTFWYRDSWDDNWITSKKELVCAKTTQSKEESEKAEDILTVEAHATIQTFQDRRFLWNVTAKEGMAKATFGVYPEEIKSLFYAREMPMTETGRKRPMLHWVAAHQRRIKSGIDIDIEKYLRGITEFVYQGTKFIITRPTKVQND